jgi:hypothetical protein
MADDSLKGLIRREIIGREREFAATVVTGPRLVDFDLSSNGAPQWAVDLDIGADRIVKNVPVKGGGSGNRFFAQFGQTVMVRRTALGRLLVIGPGDRVAAARNTTTYSLETSAQTASATVAFSRVFFPFESFMGPQALKGNPNITIAAAGDTLTRDAGSWLVDGFANLDSCRLAGTLLNDGVVTVNGTPSATVLAVSEALTDEGSQSGVTLIVEGTGLWGVSPMPNSQLQDQDGNPV